MRAWLGDPQGRDQYATYRGDEVEIHWHGKSSQCEVSYSKVNWTDLYLSWSPLGTYAATLHRQGVRLWGGSSWEPQSRFAHPLVKLIDFSPNEQYLATWSYDPIVVREGAEQGPQYFSPEDEGNNIAVWDIKTGHLLRTFPSAYPEGDEQKKQMAWPALKWSPDDKYVARVTPGQQISVYELPGMGLQGKKSIKIEGVVDFEWRPLGDRDREEIEKENKAGAGKAPKKARENTLAFWTPEVQNQPARVSLMYFPSRETMRQKNLFNVSEVTAITRTIFCLLGLTHPTLQCKLYWQNQGDFLCVKVDRHTKTKKSIFCNLEIFRVREKDFPVEVVELKGKLPLSAFRQQSTFMLSSQTPSPTSLGNPRASGSQSFRAVILTSATPVLVLPSRRMSAFISTSAAKATSSCSRPSLDGRAILSVGHRVVVMSCSRLLAHRASLSLSSGTSTSTSRRPAARLRPGAVAFSTSAPLTTTR